jgi:uncharacterized protein with PIN domain
MSKTIPIPATYADASSFVMATCATLAMLNQKSKSIPPEESIRLEQECQQAKKQQRIEYFIHQGRCPDCGSKLIRGKKDKRNDYKRTWTCGECEKTFTL